jgi:hypothetical protein
VTAELVVLNVVKVMVVAWLQACLPMTQLSSCEVRCGRRGQINDEPHYPQLHTSQVQFCGNKHISLKVLFIIFTIFDAQYGFQWPELVCFRFNCDANTQSY